MRRPFGRPVVREHEVDGLADREDLRRLLVGHAHAVGVLELLHERVQVERVGLEVLLEARVLADRRRLDVELVGEVRLDQREHLLARARASSPAGAATARSAVARRADGHRRRGRDRSAHSVCARLASGADTGASLQRARARQRALGPPDDVLARAALGAQDRLGEAGAREAPVRHDAEPAQPEQVGAALPLGVDLLAKAAERAAQQQRRRASPRVEDIAASRTAPRIVCETPSISFSATLPVKPSVTTTSATPAGHVAALDVADELERAVAGAGALAQLARAPRRTSGLPRSASSPLDSSPTRGRCDAEHGARERGAHERELDEVLAAHLGVRADVEQRHRAARAPAAAAPAPGGRCRARA